MKHRLIAVVALAASVAIPAAASAATAHDTDAMHASTSSSRTMVIVPHNGDPAEALFAADHTYLTSLCPNVLSHPGNYTAPYKRFCGQSPS